MEERLGVGLGTDIDESLSGSETDSVGSASSAAGCHQVCSVSSMA